MEAKTARTQAEKLQKECGKIQKEQTKAEGEVEKLMAALQVCRYSATPVGIRTVHQSMDVDECHAEVSPRSTELSQTPSLKLLRELLCVTHSGRIYRVMGMLARPELHAPLLL